MRPILPIICFFLATGFSFSGNELHSFRDNDLHVDYQMRDGLLNGHYVSWYQNGNKKSEGEFKNNLRTGVWDFWDSTGKENARILFGKYNSADGYEMTMVFPDSVPPKYTSDMIIPVSVERKVWSFLMYNKSNPLFAKDRLYNLIAGQLEDGGLDAYDSDDSLIKGKDQLYPRINGKPYCLKGYRMIEDLTFGSAGRIFNGGRICAVVKNTATQKDSDLAWVNFERLGYEALQVKLSAHRAPRFKNLADVFDQQYFAGEIYRESDWIYSNGKYAEHQIELKKSNPEKNKIALVELESDWILRGINDW